jgi:hypothetical protein
MEHTDIVTRLRQQQEGMLRKGEFAFVNRTDIIELVAIVDTLREERDEARRMYCGRVSRDVPLDAFDIAKNHGWNCFPQEDGK